MTATATITPCFALGSLSDEMERAAEELSFVIHGIRSAIEDGDGDGALFVLMGIRDKLGSLSEYAMDVVRAEIKDEQP